MRHQSWKCTPELVIWHYIHVYDISQTPYDTRVQRRRRRKSASPHSGSRTVFAPGNAQYSLWRSDTKTYRKLRLSNRSGISRFVQRWWALNVIGVWNLCRYGLSVSQPVMSACHIHKHKRSCIVLECPKSGEYGQTVCNLPYLTLILFRAVNYQLVYIQRLNNHDIC